jgi:hypothetical protein
MKKSLIILIKKLIIFLMHKNTFLKDVLNVIRGFNEVNKGKDTPHESFISMINLFCRTGGRSNYLFHKVITILNRKIKIKDYHGILQINSRKELSAINKEIQRKGYKVFSKVLSDDILDYLFNLGLKSPTCARPLYHDERPPIHNTIINFNNLVSIHYDLYEKDLINDPIVQSLITDKSIIAIAQEYLGCAPVSNTSAMWWQTDYHTKPNAEAATMWHFDMDNIRWLNFFFYINDVDSENGPHCFIEGTHIPGAIPTHLLSRGYARITDEEVLANFPPDRVKEFVGEKGTLIVEDTIGLHKGKHLLKGNRLLLQIRYSNHIFGGRYPESKFNKFKDIETEMFIKNNSKIFRKYL